MHAAPAGKTAILPPARPACRAQGCGRDNWREFNKRTIVSCPACINTRGAGTAAHPSNFTETTIATLATRPAAHIAAGLLLSCALAPAQAHQPASAKPLAACTAGQPCRAAGTVARPHAGSRQALECKRLLAAIHESEQAERRVRAAMMESIQPDLLILRKRYRQLGCRAGAHG